jgi:membrane protein
MNFFRLLSRAGKLWLHKGGEQQAAALAYFTPFALAPLLLISITLVGIIIGRADVVALLLRWGSLIDPDLPAFMSSSLANFEVLTTTYTLPVLALLFFSIMILFALNSLSSSLQKMWDVESFGLKSLFWRSGRAILFILVFQVYLVVTIMSNNTFALAAENSGLQIFYLFSSMVFFSTTTLLFAIGYGLLPLSAPRFRSRMYGAAVATVLFLFTRSLVALHVATSPSPDIYGAAGLLLVLLIWIYMSACILYFGAAFAKVHQDSLPVTK